MSRSHNLEGEGGEQVSNWQRQMEGREEVSNWHRILQIVGVDKDTDGLLLVQHPCKFY